MVSVAWLNVVYPPVGPEKVAGAVTKMITMLLGGVVGVVVLALVSGTCEVGVVVSVDGISNGEVLTLLVVIVVELCSPAIGTTRFPEFVVVVVVRGVLLLLTLTLTLTLGIAATEKFPAEVELELPFPTPTEELWTPVTENDAPPLPAVVVIVVVVTEL